MKHSGLKPKPSKEQFELGIAPFLWLSRALRAVSHHQ
jgi:hypothetical protein